MHNIPGFKKFFEADKGPGAGAEAPKETFENKQTATTEDIAAVLHFDPFKKGEEIPEAGDKPATGNDNAKPGAGDAKIPAKAEEKTNLPVTPTKPAESTSETDQAKHWREIAEARQADLERVAPKKTEEGKTDEPKIPAYDFTISDGHMEALASEDFKVRKDAMQALVKGVAMGIHTQIQSYFQESFGSQFKSVPAQIMQVLAAKEQADEIRKDFYGTYPELNHPQLKQLVQQVGEATAKKLGVNSWTKELRDATAKEVKAIIGVTTAPNGKDPVAPPRMLPSGGARPPVNTGNDLSSEIADTLGF